MRVRSATLTLVVAVLVGCRGYGELPVSGTTHRGSAVGRGFDNSALQHVEVRDLDFIGAAVAIDEL